MKLSKIRDLLDAEVMTGEDKLNIDVQVAGGCDLMSDVLRYSLNNGVILTGLVNKQVLNTADMAGIHCIVFVRGKKPTPDILELGQDNDMIIMITEYTLYQGCGILFANGLSGGTRE